MENKQNPKLKKLYKLAQDWATATMDPEIKDMAHDVMAGFAFTSTPQLAKVISSMAKDPKIKEHIIKKVAPYIGWQGDPLYSTPKETSVEPESGMGMGMTPPTAETKPEPMGPTETAMPAAAAPQPTMKNAPQAQPFKPGINPVSAPAPAGEEEMPPESLGMRFNESNLYSQES